MHAGGRSQKCVPLVPLSEAEKLNGAQLQSEINEPARYSVHHGFRHANECNWAPLEPHCHQRMHGSFRGATLLGGIPSTVLKYACVAECVENSINSLAWPHLGPSP